MNIPTTEPIIAGIISLVLAVLIYVFSRLFDVKEDGNVEKIEAALPGANCGGCGYPSCHALAEAIAKDSSNANKCVVGGKDVTEKICALLDIKVDAQQKKAAFVRCIGGKNTFDEAQYTGEKRCRLAATVGNCKACTYGCIGYGDCVEACQFDAIRIGPEGYPVVDQEKCTACGACVKACPLNINILLPYHAFVYVACSSHDNVRDTPKNCTTGCIGCGVCVKVCPSQAITLENNLAVIDNSKCTKCGLCAEKCPRKVILKG